MNPLGRSQAGLRQAKKKDESVVLKSAPTVSTATKRLSVEIRAPHHHAYNKTPSHSEEDDPQKIDSEYIIEHKPPANIVRKFIKANVKHVRGSSESSE